MVTTTSTIMLLAKGFPPTSGGVERYSEEVARQYLVLGYEVVVLTQTEGPRGWQTRHYPEGDLRLYNTGTGSQLRVFLNLQRIWLSNAVRRRPAFVHATTWRVAIPTLVTAWRQPLVLTVHGREVLNTPTTLRPLLKMVLRNAKVVATVSNATASALVEACRAVEKERIVVAPNGLSYTPPERRKSGPLPGAPVRILTVARLVKRKNIQSCIEALGELRDELAPFKYIITGTGPMRAELEELIKKSHLEDVVEMSGYVADERIPELYSEADIFLHPQTHIGEGNDFEGFGLVIADAMSFGCTVLAGIDGGPRDFVTDGRTGLLVDGTDSRAVRDSIRRLVRESDERERLGRAGQEYVLEHLSWARHVSIIVTALLKREGSHRAIRRAASAAAAVVAPAASDLQEDSK